jgi:hypothetical protein
MDKWSGEVEMKTPYNNKIVMKKINSEGNTSFIEIAHIFHWSEPETLVLLDAPFQSAWALS